MQKDPFDLSGRIALVSGGSRGIGEAIARIFASKGAHVIVTSRKLDGCIRVAESIVADGGSAEARACHVGEVEDLEATFAWVREKHGKLDVLVNNAAANPYFGHVLDTDLGAFQKTVDVNVRGYFFASTLAGKLMRDGGGGSIINVASVNGVVPAPMQGIYSITKAAILSMTRAFAKECAPFGIRVNALLPGITDTKFAAALTSNAAIRDPMLKMVPMGRIADPSEMAGIVLYLASDAASYTTGACINVDGGMLA